MFVETRPLVLLLFFVLGLLAGSAVVVVIHRDRARVPLTRGSSGCPTCGAPAPWHRRIPMIGYIAGRGRWHGCGDPIRLRDPVVELVTGLTWALVAARLGVSSILPAFLAYTTTLIVVSAIDLDERRIPNKVLGPMAVVGALLLLVAVLAAGDPRILLRLAGGAVAYMVPMLALALITPGAMGMGDVKLAGYVGMHLAWFGFGHVFFAALLGFLIGALVGIVLVVSRKKGRKDMVPFGPSMALGGMLPLFLGSLQSFMVV